jgi:cellulose biosynthesis protein BcsQ
MIWKTMIYKRVSISESPGLKQNVFEYEPDSEATRYFVDLAGEFVSKMGGDK